jgi:4-hydroxy-tetrahydrodipicolinate reductase
MNDMRLAVAGATGRMGRALVRAISETHGIELVAALQGSDGSLVGQDSGALAGIAPNGIRILSNIDRYTGQLHGIVDFTSPAVTLAFADRAVRDRLVYIIGTTGIDADSEEKLREAARNGAVIVKSGNMSLGVNFLAMLVKQAALALDDEFDIEIVEMHHNKKIDAPSGTALLLRSAATEARSIDLAPSSTVARGTSEPDAIGFAILRGGTVVGEHKVIFAGPGERLELSHKAEDRMIFARGALRAALWARHQKAGLYSMRDVLSSPIDAI